MRLSNARILLIDSLDSGRSGMLCTSRWTTPASRHSAIRRLSFSSVVLTAVTRDVERRQANLADVREQVALQPPLHVSDRARPPLEHVVLKPAGGIRAKRQIVLLAGAGPAASSAARFRRGSPQAVAPARPSHDQASSPHDRCPSASCGAVRGPSDADRTSACRPPVHGHQSIRDWAEASRSPPRSPTSCGGAKAHHAVPVAAASLRTPGSPQFGTRCPKLPAEPGRYRVLPAPSGQRTQTFPLRNCHIAGDPLGATHARGRRFETRRAHHRASPVSRNAERLQLEARNADEDG
jgi:hypothetical protein